MRSSGITKGLAVSAISALAISGVPALAGSAHAAPITDQVDAVTLLSERVSFADDGANTTASLVAAAPTGVTSIAFQYRTAGGDWQNIGTAQRNEHGAFTVEWSRPAGLADGATVQLRAVPNTGAGDADTATDVAVEASDDGAAVELDTEGRLGIYANPRTGDGYVAVRGTASAAGPVTVTDALQSGTPATTGVLQATTPEGGGAARFAGVLTYPGNDYDYSAGSEPNQVALRASFGAAEDVEASTYYRQSVEKVVAEPERTNLPGDATTEVTVTVTDAQGKPVAGADVGYLVDTDTSDQTPATDRAEQGRTDANGQVTLEGLGAGSYTVYADTNGTAGHQDADVEAQPFTLGAYQQQLTSVTITADPQRPAYDVDELDEATFELAAKDQQGNGVAGEPLQYRWTVDPAGAGQNASTQWTSAGDSGDDGTAQARFPALPTAFGLTSLPAGSYTLEARRPNVQGSGLTEAEPISFEVGESEITFAGGARENAAVGSSHTLTGTLALTGSGTALAGREVTITLSGATDATFAPTADQPQGTTVSGGTATATTDARGRFQVTLRDPAGPPNVPPAPETVNVTATAQALVGPQGGVDATTPEADASDRIAVAFDEAAEVGRIEVTTEQLFGGAPAPGKPVDLDVVVRGKDGDSDPANDPTLSDVPVTVRVDKGFLSPHAESVDDLALDPEHDDAGDLFGFYEDLGADEEISTGDDGTEAGIVAAIGRDEDFDDDGRATVTVTVQAGEVTETKTITFSSGAPLNLGEAELVRAGTTPQGEATVGQEVDFNLFARDQFGNLVGEYDATISDDTPQAEVRTDGQYNATRTDYVNSNAGITATSQNAVQQTLTATMDDVPVTKVAADGGPTEGETRRLSVDSEPITWADEPDTPPITEIVAKLRGANNGTKADRLRVVTEEAAAGATVKLFKIVNGKRKVVARGTVGDDGTAAFTVRDRNRKKLTTYVAKVKPTETTSGDVTNKRRVR